MEDMIKFTATATVNKKKMPQRSFVLHRDDVNESIGPKFFQAYTELMTLIKADPFTTSINKQYHVKDCPNTIFTIRAELVRYDA